MKPYFYMNRYYFCAWQIHWNGLIFFSTCFYRGNWESFTNIFCTNFSLQWMQLQYALVIASNVCLMNESNIIFSSSYVDGALFIAVRMSMLIFAFDRRVSVISWSGSSTIMFEYPNKNLYHPLRIVADWDASMRNDPRYCTLLIRQDFYVWVVLPQNKWVKPFEISSRNSLRTYEWFGRTAL